MSRRLLIPSALLIVLLILAGMVDAAIAHPDMTDEDIYYSYVEGQRLLHGQDPYARILGSDMLTNQKYATYFPVFYELSFLSQKAGLTAFPAWLSSWGMVFIVFELGCAALLFGALARRGLPWAGLFAAGFWLFNRWTLKIIQIVNLDFIPIFLLLLSLELFARNKWLSLLLFSLSLGVKQIAIFVTPLYLIWLWQSSHEHRVRDLLTGAAVIASVPLVSSIPFLIWNARAFTYSVLFSITRVASQPPIFPSALGAYLGGNTALDRVAMLGSMLFLYILAWRLRRAHYFLVTIILLVFVSLNPVLYVQYIAWIVAPALLILCDVRDEHVASAPPQPAPA